MVSPRQLLRPLGWFVVALLAGSALYWLLLREAHHSAMLTFVNEVFYRIDPNRGFVLVAKGTQDILEGPTGRRLLVTATRESLDLLLVGSVFLPALVVATPLTWRRRAGALGLGLLALVALQVVQVSVAANAGYWTQIDLRDRSDDNQWWAAPVQTTCNFLGLVLPPLLWYAFAGRPWLRGRLRVAQPAADAAPPTPGAARNEPCPCGSGKKYKKCCLLKETVR